MPIRSWVSKWFRSNKRRTPYSKNKSRIKLDVETLEGRVVPSGLQPNPTIFQPDVAPSTPVNTEGQTVMVQSLLQFADTDPGALTHLTATITWGDGTQTVVTSASTATATIVNTGGNNYEVDSLANQAKVYEEVTAGTLFAVSISDDGFAPPAGITGASTPVNSGNGVADPAVTVNANSGGPSANGALTAAEGTDVSGAILGTFTDSGNPSGTFDSTQTAGAPEYSVVIHWGDGSSDTTIDSFHNASDFVYTSGGTFQILAPSHTYTDDGPDNISLTVTHEGQPAVGPTQTATITLTEGVDNVTTNNTLTVAEGATGTIGNSLLVSTADPGDPATEIVYTLTANPAHGTLYLNGTTALSAAGPNTTFTQDDINNGRLTYVNDATSTGPDSTDTFNFSVQDGTGTAATATFKVNITEAAALVTTNNTLAVAEGATGTIGNTLLASAADVGDPATEIVYTLTANPAHGTLFLNGTTALSAAGPNSTFTQDDINNGRITYVNDPTSTGPDSTDSFNFSVQDDNGTAATGTFNMSITEGAATVATNNTLTVGEGTTGTIGNTLLVSTADAGDPATEIVYTLTANPAHGTLYLNGTTALSASGPNSTFTQDDINNGKITYVNDATSSGPDSTDSFNFSVQDDNGTAATGTFNISITEAAATVTTNNTLTVNEGTTGTIDNTLLVSTADANDPATELVYTLTANPTQGTLYLNGTTALSAAGPNSTFTQDDINNGRITYANNGSLADGNDAFKFSVKDDTGTAATGTFNITVTEAAAAVATNNKLTVAEGATGTIGNTLLASTTDPGDPATEIVYTLTANPTHGTLYLNGTTALSAAGPNSTFTQDDINNGRITYVNNAASTGPDSTDSFNFSVQDNTGTAATGTFNMSITEGADSVTTNNTLTVAEGATGTIGNTLLASTADAGDPATEIVYTLTANPAHGTLYLNGTTALSASGPNTTFTQDDINNNRITYVNDATSSGPDSTDSFNFSVQDDNGTAATGTFNVSITEGAATVTTNNTLTIGEGTTGTIGNTLLVSTADAGDPASEIVYTLTANPTHGTLYLNGSTTLSAAGPNSTFTQDDINNGRVTYVNDAGSSGADSGDSFNFSVKDDTGTAATGTFNVSVTEGAASVTANNTLTVAEGTTGTIDNTLLVSTADPGDPATEIVYTLTANPAHGTLYLNGTTALSAAGPNSTFTQDDINNGKITYVNDATSTGPDSTDSFNFSVKDDTGTAATGTFNVNITEAAALVTANNSLTVAEGATGTIGNTLLASTADPSDPATEIVYTLTANPTHGTLYLNGTTALSAAGPNSTFTQDDINNGRITYVSNSASTGPDNTDSFNFLVQDDTGTAATGTFNISITEGAASVTTNNTLTVGEGTTGTIDNTLLVSSADAGDPATEIVYTLSANPTHGTLYLNGTTALSAAGPNSTFTQDDINNGRITYVNDATSSGPDSTDSFNFSVKDDTGTAATGTFNVSITEAAATVTTNNTLTVSEGTTGTIGSTLLASSADAGDPATEIVYTLTANSTHGTLYLNGTTALSAAGPNSTFTQDDINNGRITYVNNAALADGNDSFNFSVKDDTGTAATGTFNITVTEAAASVNTNNTLTVAEGATGTIGSTLLAASTDPGDPATEIVYTLTANPAHGTLYLNGTTALSAAGPSSTFTQDDINNGRITYVNDPTSTGPDSTDSFNFSVQDDTGTPATGTFNLNITEGAASVATNSTLTVAEGTTGTIGNTLLVSNADAGDPATEILYTLTANPTHGTLYLNGTTALSAAGPNSTFTQDDINNGRITYVSDATSAGPDSTDSFNFSVRDDSGTPATGTFNIGITEATPTVVQNNGLSLNEGDTATIDNTLLGYAADPGDPASEVTYTVTALPTSGNLLLNGNSLGLNSTFTQADINNGLLSYQNTGADPAGALDSFSFDVRDDNSLVVSDIFSITVNEPGISVTNGTPISAVEGASTGTVTVASFTHANGIEPAGEFTAFISWGDSAVSLGLVSQPGGSGNAYVVTGSHIYPEEGNYSVQVEITEDGGADSGVVTTDTAAISDPAVSAVAGPQITTQEGMSTNLVLLASFTDPGGAEATSEYAASVNWGDSTPVDNSAIIVSNGNGTFYVFGTHVYAEESPAAGFTVTTTIHHYSEVAPNPVDTQVQQTAYVWEQALVNVAAANLPTTGQEGTSIGSITGIASFTDPAGVGNETANGDFSAVINWGDGQISTGTVVSLGSGNYRVDAPAHTYAEEGTYVVSVIINHDGSQVTSPVQLITVSDAPISTPVAANLPGTGQEGVAVAAVNAIATFSDPAGAESANDYLATINWGDGTTSPATVINTGGNNFQVNAPAHTYVEQGTYTVQVIVQHDTLAAATSNTQQIVIADQPLSNLASANLPASAVEGSAVLPITGIATFTDPAGAGQETVSDFSAIINWGDLTTSPGAVVSLGNGNYRVDAPAHTYAEEGTYTVNVSLTHDVLGAVTTPNQSITVSDPAVALTPTPFNATQGAAFASQTVATFTDPGGAELVAGAPNANEYSATIDWGDGTAATTGTITYSAGTFSVAGGHTYANPGSYFATITVSHGGAPDATTTTLVNVSTGVANKLIVANVPSTVTAGQSFNFQVDVEDGLGNLVTTDHSQVSVTPIAQFTSGSAMVQATGGVASFSGMSIQTVGNYTLTFSDGSLTTTTATISVVAAAPARIIAQAGTPQSATVGQSFGSNLSVLVTDAYGNAISGLPVTFSDPGSGATAAFTGSNTANTNASGIASVAVTANTVAGSYAVSATAAGLATTFQLTNLPGTASQLLINPIPSTSTAGEALPTFQVEIEDGNGNLETGDNSTLTLSLNNSGTFSAGTTSAQAINGVATFSGVTIEHAANYTLTVSDANDNLTTTTSLTINPSSAATLSVASGSSQSAEVGTAYTKSLKALVTDVYGNPVPNVTVTFTAPASGASGTLGGSSVQTDAFGIASTTITANTIAGGFTVGASALGNILSTSFQLTNTPGTPASLVLGPVATTITAGQTLPSFQVTIEDGDGNVETADNATLAVSLNNNGSFTAGNTSVQAVNGVAVFSGLVAQNAGTFTMTIGDAADNLSVTSPLTVNPAAALITASAGNGQTAAVGTVFGTLQAKVTDAFGNPLSGVNVTFAAPANGPGGMFTVNGNPSLTATVATDNNGVATAPVFTANVLAGAFTVTAAASGIGETQFSLANLSGNAANIVVLTGTPQSVTIGNTFAAQEVLVTDASGNAVSGASVTFAIVAGSNGAGGTFTGNATVTTNAQGVAVGPVLTANTTAGSFTVTASVAGISSPATFELSNTPGAATTIAPVGSTSLNTPIGFEFGTQLQVLVTDASGNPVANVPVTFAAPTNGPSGTFSASTTVVTNALGIATAPTFTANRIKGSYNVTATAAGVGVVTFNMTNTAVPAAIHTYLGSGQKAPVTFAYSKLLEARVVDAQGNPVSGITVVFSLQSTSGPGGTFAGPTAVVTNSSGIATAPAFTANQVAGKFTVVASVVGVSSPALFTLTNTAGAPASISVVGSGVASATVGTSYASSALKVLVTDVFGNAVSGAKVTYVAPSSGPSGKFSTGLTATPTTGSAGIAAPPTFTANSQTGTFTLTATVAGVATPATFDLTNLPAPPSKPRVG